MTDYGRGNNTAYWVCPNCGNKCQTDMYWNSDYPCYWCNQRFTADMIEWLDLDEWEAIPDKDNEE